MLLLKTLELGVSRSFEKILAERFQRFGDEGKPPDSIRTYRGVIGQILARKSASQKLQFLVFRVRLKDLGIKRKYSVISQWIFTEDLNEQSSPLYRLSTPEFYSVVEFENIFEFSIRALNRTE